MSNDDLKELGKTERSLFYLTQYLEKKCVWSQPRKKVDLPYSVITPYEILDYRTL